MNDASIRPVITQEEFKTIFQNKENCYINKHIKNLKTKLDGLIETSEWECDDIIEHDYHMVCVLDCIIYYVSGFIIKKLRKKINCEICKTAFTRPENLLPEAELVNLKS